MKRTTRKPVSRKDRLKAAGATYDDVARLARVTWRMVKYVVDGQRVSANVDHAIDQLTGASNGGA